VHGGKPIFGDRCWIKERFNIHYSKFKIGLKGLMRDSG